VRPHPGSASSTPTLQNFLQTLLQNLLQNLQTEGVGTQSSGLLVQATA
jgi:hypothetical protein